MGLLNFLLPRVLAANGICIAPCVGTVRFTLLYTFTWPSEKLPRDKNSSLRGTAETASLMDTSEQCSNNALKSVLQGKLWLQQKQYYTENSKVRINAFQRSPMIHFLITQPQIPSLSTTSSWLSFTSADSAAVQDESIHPPHPILSCPPPAAITCWLSQSSRMIQVWRMHQG